MQTFLGIPIARKRLTDAEYVERIRKNVDLSRRAGKWFALFGGIVAVVWVGLVIWFTQAMIAGFLGIPPVPLLQGLAIGGLFGLMFAFFAFKIAHFIVQAINMRKADRTETLLLKYYDAIVELARSERDSSAEEQAEQGRAGERERQLDVVPADSNR
jgi:hypothetical protein